MQGQSGVARRVAETSELGAVFPQLSWAIRQRRSLWTYAHLWPDADDRTREAVEEALAKIDRAADTVRTDGRSP